jgi:putative transposase
MGKSRFSEEQIIGILKMQEAGMTAAELCRKHGMIQASFYTCKAKYGGLDAGDEAAARA